MTEKKSLENRKAISFGRFYFVFDFYEKIKFSGFLAGFFCAGAVAGFILAVKEYNLFASLILCGASSVLFLIFSFLANRIIDKHTIK